METETTTTAVKRPASHKWALSLMLLASMTGLFLGWQLGPKVGYANYFNADQIIFIGLAFFGTLSSIAAPRKRITYVVTTASLAMFAFRGLRLAPAFGSYLFPDVQRGADYVICCAIGSLVALLPVFLLWRYTFGSASRRYFGW